MAFPELGYKWFGSEKSICRVMQYSNLRWSIYGYTNHGYRAGREDFQWSKTNPKPKERENKKHLISCSPSEWIRTSNDV